MPSPFAFWIAALPGLMVAMAANPPHASSAFTVPAFTFSQLADSCWVADSLAGLETAYPNLHYKFMAAAKSLRKLENRADDLDFTDMLKATRPMALDEAPSDMGQALRHAEFIKTVTANELHEALVKAGVPEARIESLSRPMLTYQRSHLKSAYDRSRNRLFRYEQRYGEKAPRLNLAEAGMAYLLHGLYPFGPNRQGPGPLEPVLRYGSNWALAYWEKNLDIPRDFTVSALWEFGVRWYWYDVPDARPGFWGLLKPSFIAGGYAMAASNRNWFFLANDESFDPGFFVDLGIAKVAMTFGEYQRVFIGKQFQIIPYLL